MAHMIERRAKSLVELAHAAGYVLTVEQRPLQPPAMGNYETTVCVREARWKGKT